MAAIRNKAKALARTLVLLLTFVVVADAFHSHAVQAAPSGEDAVYALHVGTDNDGASHNTGDEKATHAIDVCQFCAFAAHLYFSQASSFAFAHGLLIAVPDGPEFSLLASPPAGLYRPPITRPA
jgi:hypothetical protein